MLGRSVCGSGLAPQLGGAARLECDAPRRNLTAPAKSIRFRQSDRLAGALWRPALAAAVPATGIVAIMGNSRANHDWSLLYSGRRSLVNSLLANTPENTIEKTKDPRKFSILQCMVSLRVLHIRLTRYCGFITVLNTGLSPGWPSRPSNLTCRV
jgi:hypothetical protein